MKKIVWTLFLGLCLSVTSLFADKLSDIQRKGTLTIGIQENIEPFSFKSRSGKTIGFNIDLANYIAKDLNVKVNFVKVSKKQIVNKIRGNHIDIAIMPVTHTTKLDKKVDFSISYFYNGQTLLVSKVDDSRTYKDFASKRIATVSKKRGAAFNVIEPLAEVVNYSSYTSAVNALKSRKVAAVTGDYATLSRLAVKNKTKLKLIPRPFTVEPYGIILKENQSNLRDELNRIIQKSIKDAEYEKMYKKWFRKSPFIEPVLWP